MNNSINRRPWGPSADVVGYTESETGRQAAAGEVRTAARGETVAG